MNNNKNNFILLIFVIFYTIFNNRIILNSLILCIDFIGIPNKYIMRDNEMICIKNIFFMLILLILFLMF